MNLIPLLEKLTIIDKELGIHRIDFYNSEFTWCQTPFVKAIEYQYNRHEPVRLIVLKARQLGISTISEGVLFNWCFIHPGTQSLVIAHESEASDSLFEKTQMYWETWPFNPMFTTRHQAARRLTWNETRSSMRVATAKNVRSGRSRTIHALHASEVAFWDDPETLMEGLRQTIPDKHGSLIILESTANGVGNYFHRTWEAACRGENDYLPLFFPWHSHPEYQVNFTTLRKSDLDQTERLLFTIGADLAHLEWRRFAIDNKFSGDEEKFKQEYPSTPREAFLTTGRNVFPIYHLEQVYKPMPGKRGQVIGRQGNVKFIADPMQGPTGLTLFKWPDSRQDYMVAGDPSHTTMGDFSCIQILNRRTLEQIGVWHGKCNPIQFAHELMRLGYYFNTAMINTEMEGPGYATIGAIMEAGYPKVWQYRWPDRAPGKLSMTYGWSTNYKRKQWCVGNLVQLVADHSIIIHDEWTYNEMMNYVIEHDGDMGSAERMTNGNSEDYDDSVMALAICAISIKTEGPMQPVSEMHPHMYRDQQNSDLFGVPTYEAFDQEALVGT